MCDLAATRDIHCDTGNDYDDHHTIRYDTIRYTYVSSKAEEMAMLI